MAIRVANIEDVGSMVDVATSSRFAHQAWEPELWALSGADHSLQSVVLGSHLADDGSFTLVSEPLATTELDGWIRAFACSSTTWVVEDFAVSTAAAWRHAGRGLLVAMAARTRIVGAIRLLVPCPRADVPRSSMLQEAGLVQIVSVRHRVVGPRPAEPPAGVRAYVGADTDDAARLTTGLDPMAECLGATGGTAMPAEGLVVDDGHGAIAVAALRPARRLAVTRAGARFGVVEPFALAHGAAWTDVGDRLMAGIDWLAAGRSEEHLLVPCGVDDVAKGRLLDELSFGWPLDVWSLTW
jgi:hypothetical protein